MCPQHFSMNVLNSGTGTDAFFIVMLHNHRVSDAVMFNGIGTSAHETGQCSFSFSGNPYEDFDRLGIDLQNCHIRFLRKPRNNGTAITGVFNISGIVLTAGGRDYASMVLRVRQLWLEKRAWYRQRREEKRVQYLQAWIDRHPDMTTLPWYFVY